MVRKTLALMIAWLVLTNPLGAGEVKTSIEAQEPWTNLFADKEFAAHFEVKGPADFKGRITWTFAAAANQRVYDKGRGEAVIAAEAKRAPIKVVLRTPTLNPGVIQEAELSVTAYGDGQKEPAATYTKKIWIFPADPFHDRKKWLEEQNIKVYDPDPKSKTAAAFKDLGIAFEEETKVGALDGLKTGVVIVGEGISFKDELELMPALVRAAQRGVRVLVLAPAAGNFLLPGSDGEAAADHLVLRRQDVIRKLDKKLDAVAWPPEGKIVATALTVKADEGKVVAEVVPAGKGWPWLAIEFPEKNGRLVVCGFPVIGAWEASPAPRYLLSAILDHLTD